MYKVIIILLIIIIIHSKTKKWGEKCVITINPSKMNTTIKY